VRCALELERGDDLVATQDGEALWIHRRESATALDLVAVAPPTLGSGEYLFARFGQKDWFALLPLLHFAREVSGWEATQARACFMFDDPNLRWVSYGYVNYKTMAEDARLHNYHSSIATVPLDSWYVHPGTARIFRHYVDRLSLLMHGNDHTYHELQKTSTHAERAALIAQALRRIRRLEQASSVQVARVMAPPHGACSEEMATSLLELGFEAACISRGSLMARNRAHVWPVSVGLKPAEFFGAGLPVIPRFNIRGDIQTQVRLAAFLGQAIIPLGHHDDLRDGLGLLRRIAGVVNSIPGSSWMDPGTIAETSYQTRRRDEVMELRMYSRRIRVCVPSGVIALRIERPWLSPGRHERITLQRGREPLTVIDEYQGQPLEVKPGAHVTIGAPHSIRVDPFTVRPGGTTLQAILRRNLCESRDRLLPTIDRMRLRAADLKREP
jgi:hypothetical protein